MADLKKKVYTGAAAAVFVLILFVLTALLFEPAFSHKKTELQLQQKHLMDLQRTMLKKKAVEGEWEFYKAFMAEKKPAPEELLNTWTEDLLNYSSANNISFTKLEPQGMSGKKGRQEELRVYLSFQGEIGELTEFITYLDEKEPLTRVDSFVVKTDGRPGVFIFELILGRVLL